MYADITSHFIYPACFSFCGHFNVFIKSYTALNKCKRKFVFFFLYLFIKFITYQWFIQTIAAMDSCITGSSQYVGLSIDNK